MWGAAPHPAGGMMPPDPSVAGGATRQPAIGGAGESFPCRGVWGREPPTQGYEHNRKSFPSL